MLDHHILPFHNTLSRREPEGLHDAGRIRVFEPGETLFSQGDAFGGLYVVVSGIVGLRRYREDGTAALVQLRRAGDYLGHEAFLQSSPHHMTAEVLTRCRLRYIERGSLSRFCDVNPGLRQDLLQTALADYTRLQERCASLLSDDLMSRLIETLLSFRDEAADDAGETIAIELPIQRKDLAALLGATPESLSRLISKLQAARQISVEGRHIRLSRAAIASPPSPERMQMLHTLMRARTALLALLDSKDAAARSRLELKIEKASRELDTLIENARDDGAGAVAAFASIWEQFKQTRQCEILPAIRFGKLAQARSTAMGVQAERIETMRRALNAA